MAGARDDPTLRIKRFPEGEYHTWTDEEIASLEAYWSIGSRERHGLRPAAVSGCQRISFYNRTDAVNRLYVQNNGNFIVTGATTTCTIGSGSGATNCTSDARLKDRIVPITGALDKLMQIKGVTFHWKKAETSGPEHLGLLAQDVEKVFPQAVDTVSDSTIGTAKTLDYAVLVAPMIEALRELKAANDNLVSKTTALETQLNAANDNHAKDVDELRKELRDLKAGVTFRRSVVQ